MNEFFYGVLITIGSILIGTSAGCYMFVRGLSKKIDSLEEEIFSKHKANIDTSEPNIQEATQIIKDEFAKRATELLRDKVHKDLKFEWNEDGDKNAKCRQQDKE